MRILVTGANGSVGLDLVPSLLSRGDEVVALDRELGSLRAAPPRRGLELVQGSVEDRSTLEAALRGVESVVHLAWSFSEDPRVLLERDLLGHQLLLELCRERQVRRLVYTSTAVVYGKPLRVPIDEGHPLRVLEARKPAYGVAKEVAEKLTLLAGMGGGPPSTIFRFWWAFGESIGGRHLRDMLRTAAGGGCVLVPAGCGGSFLSMDDLSRAVGLALDQPAAAGQVLNLASAYVTWEEVARMAVRVTGSTAGVEVVPRESWTGAAFLADAWELDDRLARDRLGYRPGGDPETVRRGLERAIARTWESIRSARA